MEKEIIINQEFTWGGDHWRILSLEFSASKMRLHICKGVKAEQILAAYEEETAYGIPYMSIGEELTEMQREICMSMRPLLEDVCIWLNMGDEEYTDGSSTDTWDPVCRCDDPDWREYQAEVEEMLEHYHLDKSWGWSFHHLNCRPFAPEDLQKAELIMHAEEKMFPGDIFTVHDIGDEITFTHPVRKNIHTLKIMELKPMTFSHIRGSQDPSHSLAMGYTLTPNLDTEEFKLMDCCDSDGSTPGIAFYAPEYPHIAASSLYNHPVTAADITWRMCFYDKVKEDISVPLRI